MAQTATRNTSAPNLPIRGAYATTEQQCTKYQVSRTTWWRWSQMPGFPKPIRFGRSVRWDDPACEAFLTQQEA
ncbi:MULTISPECIES: helix-turn-helix transcriptional regulator [Azotobacter]|uniref:helix-turn-helix transcriptional regulator n=1 Tax=Azotobacter TaxID=352 RepID=UPI00058576EA|nr:MULTISPECIES: hypothetical protein [Azotobacter]